MFEAVLANIAAHVPEVFVTGRTWVIHVQTSPSQQYELARET